MNDDIFGKAALQIIAESIPTTLRAGPMITNLLDATMHLVEEPSNVDHPNHYRASSGVEAIEAIEAWALNFNLGNVVKYVCRAGLKAGTPKEDLEKALWYLQRELANISDAK